jgi:hypothetical protein
MLIYFLCCRFPAVARLAKEYLCMPATEVPSERAFSVAGLTVTKLRSSLDPDTVDHIIFINKNYDVASLDCDSAASEVT